MTELLLGLTTGFFFGFLLQKGGVAKFEVLIGVLLLEDFTVVEVMLTAVLVGMIGVHLLNRSGLVRIHTKPTRYGSNVIGGLIFGVGFALSAYCPGTGAAALGQGNFDALGMMAGMVAGSWVFAEASGWIASNVDRWGERGQLTLPQLVHVRKGPFVAGFAVILGAILVVLAVAG